ncbi:hypothetical protein Cgig2_004208 [Carnegiea gigantea]|uniref:NPR1/NIM1-like C-terminal domain-containing protein n=1 Tax=Carnegiea gigantea TaxID=171969 RepID=A0A9Q1JH46_9CARY|nr:hypothetical protein Cgig2_004208 [Carnegiea gigantea]
MRDDTEAKRESKEESELQIFREPTSKLHQIGQECVVYVYMNNFVVLLRKVSIRGTTKRKRLQWDKATECHLVIIRSNKVHEHNCEKGGYTVLHVAAMGKEPKRIVSLLAKGAQPTDVILDGRKALQMAKGLTKAMDFYKSAEQGKAVPEDRLCIEILEQAERGEPLLGRICFSCQGKGRSAFEVINILIIEEKYIQAYGSIAKDIETCLWEVRLYCVSLHGSHR